MQRTLIWIHTREGVTMVDRAEIAAVNTTLKQRCPTYYNVRIYLKSGAAIDLILDEDVWKKAQAAIANGAEGGTP